MWQQLVSVRRSAHCSLAATGASPVRRSCSFPSTGERMMKRELTVHSVSLSSVWQSWDLHLHLCELSDRNTDKEVFIRIGKPYMRIVGWAYPLQVFAVLISFLLRSTERVKAPLICSIVGLVVNFCLNFVLIYGKFGAPKMGAAGAAVGTLASAIINYYCCLSI